MYLSANVSGHTTRVTTPGSRAVSTLWLTGRQCGRVLRVEHRPSVPSLKTLAIRAERAGLDPGRVIQSRPPMCAGRLAPGPLSRDGVASSESARAGPKTLPG